MYLLPLWAFVACYRVTFTFYNLKFTLFLYINVGCTFGVRGKSWFILLFHTREALTHINICIYYNRPNAIVGNTDYTQGMLRLVVTRNVKLQVSRLDKNIDNRSQATSCLLAQLFNARQFNSHNQMICVRHYKKILSKHLLVIAPVFPFSLLARVSTNNCLRTQLWLASRPHP